MDKYGRYNFSHIGEDAATPPPKRTRRRSSAGIRMPSVGTLVVIALLLILVLLMAAALVVLIVKKPQIEVAWDTMVTARKTLRNVNTGIDWVQAISEHYNLSAVAVPDQGELQRTLVTVGHGTRDLMGLISEIRGSDLLTRYSKLAFTLDKVLGDEENRRSLRRILRTTADALESTTHDDVRSIVSAFDFDGLHECLESADKVVSKVRSLVDDVLRSKADEGLKAAVDKLVALSKDPQFADMIRETPILFAHVTDIVKSDDFKLIVSAGGQVLHRADGVLEEAEQADLVGRSDHVLLKIEHIAAQVEGIVRDLEDNGINIGVGKNGQVRTRALPSA